MSTGFWDLSVVALTALGFAATLQAVGAVLFERLFGAGASAVPGGIGSLARAAAVTGIAAAATRQMLMAGQLAGAASGLVDARIHEMLLTTDAGTATCLRMLGLLLITVGAGRTEAGEQLLRIVGAVLATVSFTLVGHTAASPVRVVLLPLLLTHLGIAAFWFGGLVPLRIVLAASPAATAAGIVRRYSRLATGFVPGLAAAGILLALLLSSEPLRLLESPYGQLLAIKLALFVLLMVPAALNRLRWVPALAAGNDGAREPLRRSIAAEAVLIVLVLVATAALTGLTSPPSASPPSASPPSASPPSASQTGAGVAARW